MEIKKYCKCVYQLSLLVMLLLLGACAKSIDGIVEDASANRSFTPSNLKIRTSADSAIITWNLPVLASGKKLTYTVDVSSDSTFQKVDFTKVVDTTGVVILEPTLALATRYFTRVKVNPYKTSAESRYLSSADAFSLIGQQYMKYIRDFEITKSSVLVHWVTGAATAGMDKILLTPLDGSLPVGTPIEVALTPAEAQLGEKLITGLESAKTYRLQLLAAGKSKGLANVRTASEIFYTIRISPGTDLAAAITAAADGDIIGLEPGTHNLTAAFNLLNKSVTIRSTSNNPADTKIKVREFSLVGDGAGVTFAGLDIDGNYSGTSIGVQFLQLKGSSTANNAQAVFKNIALNNCIIHDYSRCFFLGNLGAAVNDQKLSNFIINNCIIYNIDKLSTGTYYTFSMEKLLFGSFTIRQSTFYAVGQGLINMSTNGLTTSASSIPTVLIDFSTFNNWGGGSGKQLFIDANANPVSFTFTNSIIANSPIAGTLAGSYRATSTSTGNVRSFRNNNYFKLYSNLTNTALPLTGLEQISNLQIDLGWTAATTTFSLASQPADSPLLKASRNGLAVGDPRWAY